MKRLARRLHRRFRSKNRISGSKHARRAARLERLESRYMMAADGLAFAQREVVTANTPVVLGFSVSVEDSSERVAISFHVQATDGQLNPAAPEVRDSLGEVVHEMYKTDDSTDGLVIVELAGGSYQLLVRGEQGRTGKFTVVAGLPGDTSHDGVVSPKEYQTATAAMVQSQFGYNHVAAQLFAKLGINITQNLYQSELDIDGNSELDINGNGDIYDSSALFVAGHSNIGSTALTAATLQTAIQAMRDQTIAGSSKTLGAVNTPKHLLVPNELIRTAWELVTSSVKIISADTATTPNFFTQYGINMVVLDYWTDANNWYLVADPKSVPTIEMGFMDGREEPELFVQDQETVGSLFEADKITYKIHQFVST